MSALKNFDIDVLIILVVLYLMLPSYISSKIITLVIGILLTSYFIYQYYKGNLTKNVIVMTALMFAIPNQGTESTGAMTYIMPISLSVIAVCEILKKDSYLTILSFRLYELILLLFFLMLNIFNNGNVSLFFAVFAIGIICNRLMFAKQKVDVQKLFKNFRLLFFLQFTILLFERFLGIKAYPSVMENINGLDSLRCTGYTGHPLVLSSFFIFYSVMLFIKTTKDKFYYVDTIVLILSCILLASRTPIAIISIVCILNFCIYMHKKIFRSFFIIGVSSISLLYILNYTEMGNVLNDTTERISTASSDQREGAFGITEQILTYNPIGIGLFDKPRLRKEIGKADIKSNAKFDVRAALIDNGFLTSIISFGYCGLILFIFYFSPCIRTFRSSCRLREKLNIIIIGLTLVLLNFSYDVILYETVLFLFFMTINMAYSSIENNFKLSLTNENRNTHPQLQ